jgi:hypothetical protein
MIPNVAELSQRIRVKFMSKAMRRDDVPHWVARFPGGIPRWGNCEFITDQNARDYDWLVVYDDFPPSAGERFTRWEEPLPCPRTHTLLITTEPSTIKVYGSAYTRQFGVVITSQEPWAIQHPGAIYCQPGLIWYYGATGHGNGGISVRGRYDSIQAFVPSEKTRSVSTVCSSKRQRHTLHHIRYDFVNRLAAALPELEIFGHGVRYAEDKADTLDPYRFHIAIENHVCRHHWTEKLADPFLGACLPFYHGCPNYADYFPAESVMPINIHDFGASLEIIRKAIRDKEDEKRRSAILESRRLYLEKYWLFAQVARVINERHSANEPRANRNETICSRHLLRRKFPLSGLAYAYEKISVSLRHKFRGED